MSFSYTEKTTTTKSFDFFLSCNDAHILRLCLMIRQGSAYLVDKWYNHILIFILRVSLFLWK